jgi:peroxiredoxin
MERAPPWPIQLAIVAGTLAAVGWFVVLGVQERARAEAELSRRLLDVEPHDGDAIPFELESLDGRTVRLSDFAGKTVLINFWATWCPPCIEELPSLRALAEHFETQDDFVLLAISTDDDWGVVRDFFEVEPPNFTVLLDRGGKLSARYGTTKFPETYVLDPDGDVEGLVVGPRRWDSWYAKAYVESLVSEDGGRSPAGGSRTASR